MDFFNILDFSTLTLTFQIWQDFLDPTKFCQKCLSVKNSIMGVNKSYVVVHSSLAYSSCKVSFTCTVNVTVFLFLLLCIFLYRPQGEGYVFTGVCLSTIGLMAIRPMLGLVTVWLVRILLEGFLVLFYYHPQRSCGKVMFLHLCVILFTGGVGSLSRGFGSLSRGMVFVQARSLSLGVSVREFLPPNGNMRAVRILLECILV